jgi:hypothetical protein
VSVWRWIALVLIAWAAPPIIARTARAISMRERRKKECPHLVGRVQELLRAEFPDQPVDSPSTPFSWFTEPELSSALMAANLFAYVLPGDKIRRKDLEYVVRYGASVGANDLRVYVHEPAASGGETSVDGQVVAVRGVRGCPCGRGS